MSHPTDRFYTKEHEWIKYEGNSATVGITAFAVEQLGDIVYVDLPKIGKKVNQGDSFGSVESTKTVSDLYMPATGTVTQTNDSLKDNPQDLASDPHEKYWLVKISIEAKPSGLMDAVAYEKYVSESSH